MSGMTKQDPTLEDLQARRRELAFQVAQGHSELQQVEGQIGKLTEAIALGGPLEGLVATRVPCGRR